MTRLIPLFSEAGEFIFELDNLLETGLNGQYASRLLPAFRPGLTYAKFSAATVSATFFASSLLHPPAPKSDLIMTLSTSNGNSVDDNAPSVPPDISVRPVMQFLISSC